MTERTPAAPLDRAAADRFWADYAAAHSVAARSNPEYAVDRFGDSAELSDELLGLVVGGTKRATADLVDEFLARDEPLPRVGSHWVACDGSGRPTVILRSTELRIGTIASVDATFARDEGEDDGSLDSWLIGHRRYWERTCAARGDSFTDDHEIVFERFQVVWPPALADSHRPSAN
ncbi:ASCH domain-containing protein [Diaminobutyricimonas sp. TR449]|uniref:ASCH domain-containing protein n=1 Tax=Diaminobutyricimonas sp. TR449 TaxID=2708076 RepID=UPI0014219ECC|nr:ASCH domain-containing protein [Diaminobutyricimonas sp. TR449]